MESSAFFQGVGFLTAAYLFYRFFLKGQKPSSKETNYVGSSLPNYIGLWGTVITLILMGVLTLFLSFSP